MQPNHLWPASRSRILTWMPLSARTLHICSTQLQTGTCKRRNKWTKTCEISRADFANKNYHVQNIGVTLWTNVTVYSILLGCPKRIALRISILESQSRALLRFPMLVSWKVYVSTGVRHFEPTLCSHFQPKGSKCWFCIRNRTLQLTHFETTLWPKKWFHIGSPKAF